MDSIYKYIQHSINTSRLHLNKLFLKHFLNYKTQMSRNVHLHIKNSHINVCIYTFHMRTHFDEYLRKGLND